MTLQQAVALAGLILGAVGSVLGVVNYLRDRAKVLVTLTWDMTMVGGVLSDPNKKWGLVKVANVGRRPIFVSHVSIRFPPGSRERILLLKDSVAGTKLQEGDPPTAFQVDQAEFGEYTRDWKKVYAAVEDSTGQSWRSRSQKWQQRPSWAVA